MCADSGIPALRTAFFFFVSRHSGFFFLFFVLTMDGTHTYTPSTRKSANDGLFPPLPTLLSPLPSNKMDGVAPKRRRGETGINNRKKETTRVSYDDDGGQ